MKIGLLSDTHGHLDTRVFHHFEKCDEIWHAGDIGTMDVLEELEAFKPVKAVFGNIDGQKIRSATNEDLIFYCEGKKVWITHIGGYPPRYNKHTKSIIKDVNPDLFICGHSHILKIINDPTHDLLHINPGAAGVQGFHKIKTLVRFEMLNDEIRDLQVIELGPKAQKNLGL